MYKNLFKRVLDITFSFLFIVLFCWLYLILAILVRCKLGAPILFAQDRPGKGEKIFKLKKFRTMTDERDENGELKPDEIRLTKFGRFLRSTSLDELPEMFNILKGEMSFVGPRPLLVKYLPYYTEKERLRHTVRPGLTGLAQINGRNNLMWDERLALDVKYVEELSFLQDVRIVFRTVGKVLKRSDVAVKRITPLDEARKGM